MDDKEDFLSRWSRRKRESVADTQDKAKAPVAAQTPAVTPAAAQPLPPVESLTPESDFHSFMKPEVDEGLKRQALKALFQDPHYNTMDMLDTYVDDYSRPDPLPEGWLAKLRQMDRLGHYQEPVQDEAEPAQAQPAVEGKGAPEQGVVDHSRPAIPDTESAVGEASEMVESSPHRPTPT